jgi:small GTP-binding protein
MENFSICVLGDRGVGKTSVCKSITSDSISEQSPVNIFVTSYHSRLLNFFDFSGNPKYTSLRKLFYKYFHGYVLVFDMSNRNSFKNLKKWEKEIKAFAQETDSPILLVGTKKDLGISEKLNREFTQVCRGEYNQDDWDKFLARVLVTNTGKISKLNEELENSIPDNNESLLKRLQKWWKPVELPLSKA